MGVTRRGKLWTGIGTAVLVGAGAANADLDTDGVPTSASAPLALAFADMTVPPGGEGEGSGGEGEGGEGGEGGGEFGVDPEEARTDPVPFGIALDIIRAHYLAGQAAYAAGDREAAGELFLHPISEVYVAMEPVFADLGIAPFEALMAKTGDLALSGAALADVKKAVAAVLSATDNAEQAAPAGALSRATLDAEVIADMVERAALQYQIVAGGAVGAAYLDGYGFAAAARLRADRSLAAIARDNADLAQAIRMAMEVLAGAYPTAVQPDPLKTDVAAVLAASSRLRLAL
ncbi:MAG: hypothetical protein ACFB6R_11885 [Alphaproteobacteria bacterium]